VPQAQLTVAGSGGQMYINRRSRVENGNPGPIDFISTHPYPMDMPFRGKTVHRSVNSTHDDLQLLRKMVNSSPYPKAEIHLQQGSRPKWNV
jgi:hypothetical protein